MGVVKAMTSPLPTSMSSERTTMRRRVAGVSSSGVTRRPLGDDAAAGSLTDVPPLVLVDIDHEPQTLDPPDGQHDRPLDGNGAPAPRGR
jgi:hypothetical protein